MLRTSEPAPDATLPLCQSDLEGTKGANACGVQDSLGEKRTAASTLLDPNGLDETTSFDDKDVDIVIVFPRQLKKPDEAIAEPLMRAKEIFPDLEEEEEEEEKEEDKRRFTDALKKCDPMSNSEYHSIIRAEIVRRLADAGFTLGAFVSIDRDEAFLKIGLNRNGEVIKQLANKFQYWMPFKKEAYKGFSPLAQKGKHKGKLDENGLDAGGIGERRRFDEYGCPLDHRGKPVPAHWVYNIERRDDHAHFTDIDGKRIGFVRISELMNLAKLKKQQLIQFWFIAADHERMEELNDKLWGYSRFFQLPSLEDADIIREYFGEQVAFFFQWNAFFTRQLVWVAGVIAVIGIVSFVYPPDRNAKDVLKLVVIGFFILWAELCRRNFSRISTRLVQKWGMKDYETRVDYEIPSYDPTLDRTMRLAMQKMFVYLCLLAFCGGFVGLIFLCYRTLLYPSAMATLTVVLIRIGYPLWSSICAYLVELQNNRTQQEYDDSLTFLVSGVKIFTTLWPFLHLAFIKRNSDTCGESYDKLLPKVYCLDSAERDICHWPDISSKNSSLSLSGEKAISLILSMRNDIFSWNATWNATSGCCISGCYPISCEVDMLDGELQYHCHTNCGDMLRDNFRILYAIHLLSTILFLVIPRILADCASGREERLAQKDRDDSCHALPRSRFLEKQAKRHQYAEYAFLSWGGSEVEDALELAISFLLLTCFGTLYPALGIFAFVCHCIEYRLLVKRMISITSRPFPNGAEGIGIWQSVLTCCIRIAVLINGGVAVFFLDPIRHFRTQNKLALFLVFENTLFILMSFVPSLDPDDVKHIAVYNNRFLAWVRAKEPVKVPEAERKRIVHIDIGLGELPGRDQTL